MTEEFNLSEKIVRASATILQQQGTDSIIATRDVKEAVKKLKEKFKDMPNTEEYYGMEVLSIIDEIFGEELSK